MAALHKVQVEILPKKKLFLSGRGGRGGGLDNLEIRLNSAQLEVELGNIWTSVEIVKYLMICIVLQ